MTAEWSGEDGQAWSAMQRALQVVGLAMFCAVLAAVSAATCVLSYAGIHAIAEQGGIQAQYARGYPLLIDAILVIVLAALLALRGAGLPSRILSWLALMVLLAAAAGAQVLHDTRRTLPRDAAAITVAVLPWLLVLVTFVLLLAILRHARLRRTGDAVRARRTPAHPDTGAPDRRGHDPPAATPTSTPTSQPSNSVSIVPGFSARLASTAAAGAAAGRAAAGTGAASQASGSARSAEPDPPDDSSDAPGLNGVAVGEPAASSSADTDEENGDNGQPGHPESPAPPAE